VFALGAACWAAVDDDQVQDLFQQHRWFELRDAVVSDRYAEALIKGAVALAFNHPVEAELRLKAAVRLAKRSRQADAARDKLIELYLRTGRTAEAVRQMKTMLKRDPTPRPETQNLLEEFRPLSARGDFSVHLPKGAVALPCEVKPEGVWLSLSVDGKPVKWLLDTGANFSTSDDSQVAAKVVVGGIEFHNVTILKGKRSVVGLPLLAAMQTLSWKRDGTCRAGFASEESGAANLAFDDFNLIVRRVLGGKPVDHLLDTGSEKGSAGDENHQGSLGMDTLNQAAEVLIDFRRMTLVLR